MFAFCVRTDIGALMTKVLLLIAILRDTLYYTYSLIIHMNTKRDDYNHQLSSQVQPVWRNG